LGPPSDSGRGDVRAGDRPRTGSDRQRIEVYRYPQVPDLAVYETTERSFVVERLTRPPFGPTVEGRPERISESSV